MSRIVAIGGGEIKKRDTLSIDKEIVRLSGKSHPRFLFIPTASNDSEGYWSTVGAYYKKLGCKVDVLFLIRKQLTAKEIKNKINWTDIIYVGGGNTLMMMEVWKKYGVDILLKQAYKKNIVLCGLSAGSICWFDSGHSDSMSYSHPEKWDYINVKGLGLIEGVHCPHFDSQTLGKKRKDAFKRMIGKIGKHGIAINNHCAIEFVDKTYRVIASQKNGDAYKVFKRNGKVVSVKIPKSKKFASVNELYS